MMRRVGRILGALLLLVAALGLWLTRSYVEPPVDPAWVSAGSETIPAGAVSVRWTGTSTLLFSDGETSLMIDGWFSRPDPLRLAFGRIEPDVEAIAQGLERNGVDRLAAVIPAHSHFDHAMDAPEVARRTGALLVGSEATAQIGRGWGLDESRIRVVRDRQALRFGRFTVTLIESRHFQFPNRAIAEGALTKTEIEVPLVPPVPASDYRLGKAYAIHVAHPRGRSLVQGSAGWVEGGLEGFVADVVFLGTGGLGTQSEAYREAYWFETVTRLSPERVIPIHWDSLTGPIDGPFTGPVRLLFALSGGGEETLAFLKEKEAAEPTIRLLTLPRYEPVLLY